MLPSQEIVDLAEARYGCCPTERQLVICILAWLDEKFGEARDLAQVAEAQEVEEVLEALERPAFGTRLREAFNVICKLRKR
jgi:hypothetical protein